MIYEYTLAIFTLVMISYILSKHVSQTKMLHNHKKEATEAYHTTFRDVFDGIQVKGRFKTPPQEKTEEISGFAISLDSIIHKA